MGMIKVDVKGMSVAVVTPSGLSVLLPVKNHQLTIDGVGYPAGSLISFDASLTATVTDDPSAPKYIVDLQQAIGDPHKTVRPALLTGAVNAAHLNARLECGGGTLYGRQCTIAPWDTTPWQFTPAYGHMVTDLISFERPVADGGSVDLLVDGGVVKTLNDGDSVVIHNEDLPLPMGEAAELFAQLDDFEALCSTLSTPPNLNGVTWKKKLNTIAAWNLYVAGMPAAAPAPGLIRICMIVKSR